MQYAVLPVFKDAFIFSGRGNASHQQFGERNAHCCLWTNLPIKTNKHILNSKLMFSQDLLDFSG